MHWLGFDWAPEPGVPEQPTTSHLYFASDYFDFMYRAAEALVEAGLAYVDEQSADEMRASRGDFAKPGTRQPVPRRARPTRTSRGCAQMENGELADGAAVLRAKIDMASPNINLRDPALYRIKRATHHNTGDRWCIYPMYTYAHPIEDALENITHSICTLEFEDQRPFYDWLLDTLCRPACSRSRGRTSTSSRGSTSPTSSPASASSSSWSTRSIVERLGRPAHADHRRACAGAATRRKRSSSSAERAGVSKADGWTDYAQPGAGAARRPRPQGAARDGGARPGAARAHELGRELIGDEAHREPCSGTGRIRSTPSSARAGFMLGAELWIERDDFAETPPKGFFRLYPGNRVRLKYGVVVECTGCDEGCRRRRHRGAGELVPDTKSGTPGADAVKVKGTITWVAVDDALGAEIRLYDRLFVDPHPDAGGKDFKASLNPDSRRIVAGFVESSLAAARPGDRFQFERHGYFVADIVDHRAERPVFNRTTTLRDTWSR